MPKTLGKKTPGKKTPGKYPGGYGTGNGGDVVIRAGVGTVHAGSGYVSKETRIKNAMIHALKEGVEPEDLQEIIKKALVEQIMDE